MAEHLKAAHLPRHDRRATAPNSTTMTGKPGMAERNACQTLCPEESQDFAVTRKELKLGGISTGRLARRLPGAQVGTMGYLLILIATLWIHPASAVFIKFQNCLSESWQHDTPYLLQFDPKYVDAVFNTTDPAHNLKVTVWGNVTGSFPLVNLPGSNDTAYWQNANETDGKIADVPDPDGANKYTTLYNKVNVLTYEPWSQTLDWCSQLVNGTCPLGPSFTANGSDPYSLPSFSMNNNFYSSYAFTSLTATLIIKNGDTDASVIACISGNITPDMGSTLSSVIKYIPAVILLIVGIATAFAGVFSPWGSADIFRWTTNYGRDADLLRLVTPGFGDCLQYIQFVALTGGLTLNYPGFYQPIVSKVSWSALMFNESFVHNRTGTVSLVDGMYVTTGKYGLDDLRQLVGLGDADDVWTGMVIWLLVILAAVLALIQTGFAARWVYRQLMNTQEEDLRAKNMPFSVGNVIRLVFNYFLLPLVALSMFQLVEAGKSPTYTVALAAIMVVLIVGFAVWLLYLIATTRPRSFLFDDLPTVLLYGSLYNTYSDNAAPFALVPVLLTFVRGISIGAVQPSGIAQLVLLAICEVITILTLHAFRPFHSATSNNLYHTLFAAARFASVLLMIAFAPSLGVTDGPKGWIGYAILLLHALVLIFLFLLNAIQTIVEVAARMAGAGGDDVGAATRGGLGRVFGMRQLSKRLPRRDAGSRASQLSSAAMLDADADRKEYAMNANRRRAESAGSNGILLNRQSMGFDSLNVDGFGAAQHQGSSTHTPTTPGEVSTFSFVPSAAAIPGQSRVRGSILGLAAAEAADPYYRPPRFRRPTIEAYSPGSRSRGSWASGDWANRRDSEPVDNVDQPEGPSISGRATPDAQAAVDSEPHEARRSQADYATREVDFYYGVRGPALNANIPSRRIKTGPADPTGIPASAAGWINRLFKGKTKEKGKGFEVVRSSRMPPNMARNTPGEESPPEGIPVAMGGIRNGPIDSDDEDDNVRAQSHASPSKSQRPGTADSHKDQDGNLVSPLQSDDDADDDHDVSRFPRISDLPPSLPGLEPSEDIELPSRYPSKASSKYPQRTPQLSDAPLVPSVPRKSSRRKSLSVDLTKGYSHHKPQGSTDSRLPFERSGSNKHHSAVSSISSMAVAEGPDHSRRELSGLGSFPKDTENDRPTSLGYVHQHNIRTINPSENPNYIGSSAEVVDERLD